MWPLLHYCIHFFTYFLHDQTILRIEAVPFMASFGYLLLFWYWLAWCVSMSCLKFVVHLGWLSGKWSLIAECFTHTFSYRRQTAAWVLRHWCIAVMGGLVITSWFSHTRGADFWSFLWVCSFHYPSSLPLPFSCPFFFSLLSTFLYSYPSLAVPRGPKTVFKHPQRVRVEPGRQTTFDVFCALKVLCMRAVLVHI